MLSVCMITFNHERWIAEAIEGVLMQATDFDFELIVSDDCSIDNTYEVVKKYEEQHPEIIKAYRNYQNLGLAKNFSQSLNLCSGYYIAICEGDDFWTDPHKLQKQIDYIKSNPNCIMVSHNISKKIEHKNRTVQAIKQTYNFQYNQKDFLKSWSTPPLTCIFRNIFSDYSFFNKEGIFCDVILFYELLKHGNGYFMKDNMATFRVSPNALSSSLSSWQWSINHILMYDYLYKYNPTDELLNDLRRKHCLILLVHKFKNLNPNESSFKPLAEYFKRQPKILECVITIFIRIPYYLVKYKYLYMFFGRSSNK